MLTISPIPAFNDNYIWCLSDGTHAVVVDPGDGDAVLNYLQEKQLYLAGILITHHHADHTGGLERLQAATSATVFGPDNPQISGIDVTVKDQDQMQLLGVEWQIIAVPGHTLDHIAYFARFENSDPVLFCGDTLFSAGCGRIFEGTPAMMWQSLNKLLALPSETRIYPAHEYTQANLAFALAVEPDNSALKQRIDEVSQLRANGKPSLPVTLGAECRYNPFLRWSEAAVVASVRERGESVDEPVAVFAAVRAWKDTF